MSFKGMSFKGMSLKGMSLKRVWVALPLLAFLGLAALLYSGLGKDHESLPSALAGKPVPAFSLPSLMGSHTLSEQALTGRWRLLNVWATWCPTCHIEHPFLMKLAARGVPIVGVDYKDDPDAARDYLADLGNPYTDVIVDQEGRFGLNLGVYGAPETYLINPQGQVVLRRVGNLDERSWRQRFLPILDKAGVRLPITDRTGAGS